jgi:hypothetical protein
LYLLICEQTRVLGVKPMAPPNDPKRVQHVFERARHWNFYPHPAGNLKDLLALLSVAVGLRRVAAFGFHDLSSEGFARDLKDKVGNLGLRTLITGPIRNDRSLSLQGIDGSILDVIRREGEERFQRNKTVLLWVFLDGDSREMILEVVKGDTEAGTVLGYPECCVYHNRAVGRAADQAFFQAIIKAVGNDPEMVLRALREDLKVEIENCAWESDNAVRTDTKFPFLLHIACDACLASDESPSALLNLQLQALAEAVGHGFADTIRAVTTLDADRIQLIIDSERKGLGPETIDEPTRARLQDLDRQMGQICADFEKS